MRLAVRRGQRGALVSAVRRERAFLVMWWAVQGAVAAGWVLALVLGAVLVGANTITLGTAFLLFQYVLLIARPLEEVVHELETVQKANGAMVRVAELLRDPADDRRHRHPPSTGGPLTVDAFAVGFDYGDDRPVLSDVDLSIGAGRSVGIVGRTGSGKTTFSRLVLASRRADGGVVSLGGVPIADIPLDELRRRVALVPQEVELFAGSIRDNVTLFDDEPTDASRDRRARSASGSARSPTVGSIARSVPAVPVCRPVRRSSWPWPGCGCAIPTSSCSTRRPHASTPRPSSSSRLP